MKHLILIAILAMLSTGCASITRGTSEAYTVNSDPAGASVKSSDGWSCETPCTQKVKRRSDFVLTIEKEGYDSVTATVKSSIDGAGAAGMAGNVILGGIIGAGVDAGTGAMHSHKPNPLEIKLARIELGRQPEGVEIVEKGSGIRTPIGPAFDRAVEKGAVGIVKDGTSDQSALEEATSDESASGEATSDESASDRPGS